MTTTPVNKKKVELLITALQKKNPKIDPQKVTRWANTRAIPVNKLPIHILVNMYKQAKKTEAKTASLSTISGILLGTRDRKFSKKGTIEKVYALILQKDGSLEEIEWWGRVPKNNKAMRTLPILTKSQFKGEWTEPFTTFSGEEIQNFDVTKIIVGDSIDTIFDHPYYHALLTSEYMIDENTNLDELGEGGFSACIRGTITKVEPYSEKLWDDDQRTYYQSDAFPFVYKNKISLNLTVTVNEDIKFVRVSIPPQKLGKITFICDNDTKFMDLIRETLKEMPIDADEDDYETAEFQMNQQIQLMEDMFLDAHFEGMGYVKHGSKEYDDEVRHFFDMSPSFVAITTTTITTTTTTDNEDPVMCIACGEEEASHSSGRCDLCEQDFNVTQEQEAKEKAEQQAKANKKAKKKTSKQEHMTPLEAFDPAKTKPISQELEDEDDNYLHEEDDSKPLDSTKKTPRPKSTPRSPKTKKGKKGKKDQISEALEYIQTIDTNEELSTLPEVILLEIAGSGLIYTSGYNNQWLLTEDTPIVLDKKLSKELTKVFKKNPTLLPLQEASISEESLSEIEKELTEYFKSLKATLPETTPEHLHGLLKQTKGWSVPIPLIEKIWNSL